MIMHRSWCEQMVTGKRCIRYTRIQRSPGYLCYIIWRHNDQGGVSNHQPHGCLLNRLFRRRSKKTSKLCVTGPLCGEFTGPGEFPAQWPVTRSFDVFFDLRLNKRLSKQPWGWWFETPHWSLWRQCNAIPPNKILTIVTHDMMTSSSKLFLHHWLLVMGNPPVTTVFHSQMVSDVELWYFHCC